MKPPRRDFNQIAAHIVVVTTGKPILHEMERGPVKPTPKVAPRPRRARSRRSDGFPSAMKHLLLLLCLAVACLAADEKKPALPPLPDTVTLKNGAVLKKVSVIRWEKNAVVLKHQGGADPIRFEHMSPESRALFEAHKADGLMAEDAKKSLVKARAKNEEMIRELAELKRKNIEDAITNKTIIVGMTEAEAARAIGAPTSVNTTGSGKGVRAQWVYRKFGEKTSYVYFEDGILTSWSN